MTERFGRLFAALTLTVVIATPLHADFAAVVRALDSQKGVKKVWIPFLGVARAVVRVASPNGLRDFELATFEGAQNLDARAVQRMLGEKLAGFTPLVRSRSKKTGEWSFIYARPKGNGDRFELVVLNHDRHDTVVVRVDIDAETLGREIQIHPTRASRVAAR
jgi:hypothetical protein